MYTFSKQLWGLHSPSTCLVQNFQIFTGDNFFHTYTLHTCFTVHSPYSYLVCTLQAHVRFKIFKFSREIILSCLHSPHMFQDSLSIQLFGLHFQAHVRFKKIEFSRKIILSCLHYPHMFQGLLSIQLFCLHSPSTC